WPPSSRSRPTAGAAGSRSAPGPARVPTGSTGPGAGTRKPASRPGATARTSCSSGETRETTIQAASKPPRKAKNTASGPSWSGREPARQRREAQRRSWDRARARRELRLLLGPLLEPALEAGRVGVHAVEGLELLAVGGVDAGEL